MFIVNVVGIGAMAGTVVQDGTSRVQQHRENRRGRCGHVQGDHLGAWYKDENCPLDSPHMARLRDRITPNIWLGTCAPCWDDARADDFLGKRATLDPLLSAPHGPRCPRSDSLCECGRLRGPSCCGCHLAVGTYQAKLPRGQLLSGSETKDVHRA